MNVQSLRVIHKADVLNNGALLCVAFGYFSVDIFSYMHYNDYNSKIVKKINSYRQKPDIFSVL